jgi:hypothetical protein
MTTQTYTSIEVVDNNDIGILIREVSSPLEGINFMNVACSSYQQEIPPRVWIKWVNPDNKEGMSLFYGYCDKIFKKQYRLHLFRFGTTTRFDFALNSLQFPVKIVGCIWIADINAIISLKQNNQSMFNKLKDAGEIKWGQEQDLSFVFAVINLETSEFSIDEFRNIFGLGSQNPVIPCPSKFDKKHIEKVLSVLVRQIEVE